MSPGHSHKTSEQAEGLIKVSQTGKRPRLPTQTGQKFFSEEEEGQEESLETEEGQISDELDIKRMELVIALSMEYAVLKESSSNKSFPSYGKN
ncbi:Hypothetical predicted protein, partial [Pelobates cultripes]